MSLLIRFKRFAQSHPALTFLLINFAWTWFFWLVAVPIHVQTLMVTCLVMIGGYGPAIAGIVTLGLQTEARFDLSRKRVVVWGSAAALIFGVIAVRYTVGNVPNYETLAFDLKLSVPLVCAALAASLTGGWVISSAVSSNPAIRERMRSILPWQTPENKSWGWVLLGLFFYPAMILLAWGLAAQLGLEIEYPALWGRSVFETLPLYTMTFVLVALTQGGNEEPGWRGFLQPELQKRFSPLVAAVLVSLAWSLWHAPLYINGFYQGSFVGGMLGGGIFRVLLAIFLAWFYWRSGGNLFLMIFLHTNFNVMVNFLPTSDLGLLILWLIVVVGVTVKDRLYRSASPAASVGLPSPVIR